MSFILEVPQTAGNPYEFYINFINSELHRTPWNGFRLRMIVLLGLTLFYVVMSLYLSMIILETSRLRDPGSSFWIWRRVSLQYTPDSSRRFYLFVTNSKLCLPLLFFLNGLYSTFYTANGLFTYGFSMSLRFQYVLQAFVPFPICVAGWMITFGNTQVALLMHQDKERQLKYAPLLNNLYMWGGLFWGLYLIGGGIFTTIVGHLYWYDATDALIWLATQNTRYSGKLGSEGLAALQGRMKQYIHFRQDYGYYAAIEFAALPLFAIIILIVNLSTLSIARFLQLHIESRSMNLQSFKGIGKSFGTSELESPPPAHVRMMSSVIRTVHTALEDQLHEQEELENYKDIPLTDVDDSNSDAEVFPTPFPRSSKVFPSSRMGMKRTPSEARLERICQQAAITAAAAAATAASTNRTTGGDSGDSTDKHQLAPTQVQFPNQELRDSFDAIDRANFIQIQELDISRTYVIAMGIGVAAAASVSCAVAIYVTAILKTNFFFDDIIRFEFTLYSFPWACAATLPPTLILLVYIQHRQRSLWKAKLGSKLEISQAVEVHIEEGR